MARSFYSMPLPNKINALAFLSTVSKDSQVKVHQEQVCVEATVSHLLRPLTFSELPFPLGTAFLLQELKKSLNATAKSYILAILDNILPYYKLLIMTVNNKDVSKSVISASKTMR